MGHHHVAVGAGLFVESCACAQAQRLWHVNLDVINEVAIPDRFEQAVGKAEGQNILRRFLAQKVIDAKDLRFVEYLVQLGIQ